MTNVQSKFTPIYCTCKDFIHPWTDSCSASTIDILIKTVPKSLRMYTVVYALSLVMRRRIPTLLDLKRAVLGTLQSTVFLSCNSITVILYICVFRNLFGKFYFWSCVFLPTFIACLTTIYLERPVRRPILALYVANVATETLWRMAECRGLVKSIPNGQVLIFGVSMSVLLYLYRLGLHKTDVCKDSIFDILRIFIGKDEECMKAVDRLQVNHQDIINCNSISGLLPTYARFIRRLKGKHECCPHKKGCIHYAVMGGVKPFVGGVGLQVIAKLVLNFSKVVTGRMTWRKSVFDRKTLSLGVFFGGFSFLYKGVSCALRNAFGRDDPRFAIPAGLVGSFAFKQYPEVTGALYVMWKTLYIIYNLGERRNILYKVPEFVVLLYSFSTAILFHAAVIEPHNLRPSFYKFMNSFSGARTALFNGYLFDTWGLKSSETIREVMKRTGTEALPGKLVGA